MTFTFEQIEQAEQYMLSTDPIIQQEAVDFIEKWKNSDDSYILAFKILVESNHVYSQFLSISIIKDIVTKRWNQLPDDFKNSLKNFLTNKLTDFYSETHLFNGACDIISLIGTFDWPEKWPDFLDVLFGMKMKPKIQLTLLDHFTSIITDGIYVKNVKRKKLFDVILNMTPDIYKMIFNGFSMQESVSIAFSVLDTQLKTLALDYYLQNGIVDKLIALSSQPDLHCMTIQCLITIFAEQYKFSKLIPYLPKLFHLFTTPELTESSSLLYLSLKVLVKYSSFICYIISGMLPEIDIDGEFKDIQVDDLESMQNNILSCLEIILSCYLDEKQIDLFWELWKFLLPHLFTEPISNLPIYEKIKKYIPIICNSLFNLLPLAVFEHEMIDTVARTCWVIALYLFPNEIIEMLKEKSPSISLCYAIGFAEKTLSSDVINNILKIQMKNLIDYYLISDDPDYTAAINFILSHCSSELFNDPNYIEFFFDITLNCLENEEETIQIESTRSLMYVAQRNTEIFFVNDYKITKKLFAKIPTVISQGMEESSIIRFIKLCSFLAYHSNNQSLYEFVITPIYEEFCQIVKCILDYEHVLSEKIEIMFSLIPEIVHYVPQSILSNFETSLVQIIEIENIGNVIGYEKMELLVKALVSIIATKTNSEVLKPLSKIYEILSENEVYYSLLFDSISIICYYHTDLYLIYKMVERDYLTTIFNRDVSIEDYTSLFRMISNFPLDAISNLGIITNIITLGITHELSVVTVAAGNYCLHFIKNLEYDYDLLCKITGSLIPSIISSITDGEHNTCIFTLISLLYELFTRFTPYDSNYSFIAHEVLVSLQLNCDEQYKNFFMSFVQKLIASVQNERHFHITIFDLLVMLRTVTSSDLVTFDEIGSQPIWLSEKVTNGLNEITDNIEKMQEYEDHQS